MHQEKRTITAIPGIRVGHATDLANVTGCTVMLLPPEGARCVVDVRGGAPGTRETALLTEETAMPVHAILLSGGSAFGLAAADGVMHWLAERGVGFPTPGGPVPIVPAAILYDLTVGRALPPNAAMGYTAAANASAAPLESGSIGAGTGATIGKLFGRAAAMQGGIGSAVEAVTIGTQGALVGALVAVNAVGDVWDGEQIVAGAHDAQGWLATRPSSAWPDVAAPQPGTNTTIGIIATNAPIPRKALIRMVISAHDGLARAIRPAHTVADGDTLFALTTAQEEIALAAPDMVRLAIATERAITRAILDAAQHTTARSDLPAAHDLRLDTT